MADNILSVKIKQRYDAESNWSANNPVLLAGEIAISSDRNGMYKTGNGTSTWSQLPYNNANTANTATRATQDESGNNIKSSYASSISISDHTITLKNKNGASLGTVTVPDNNTWRGIQNNLTSDSTTDSLSAAQGKVLKGLVDGKANSSHTHNYAGSSSAGGSANTALGLSPFTISNIDELDSFLSDNAIMKYAKASSCNIGFVSNDGLVISLPWSSNYGAQIAIDDQSNWMGIRTKNNGTWNSWSKIALVSDIPTSLPASDVYSWAKASSKPSYSWSEITSKPSTFTPSNHSHNYAGSSSAGGSATSAVKLDSSAGSATQPVYFSGGKPVACSYTLGKSVPSNAVFTDTNTKVTQTVTTSNASYPLLLAPNGQTATATTTSYFDSGVTLNPSTNTIVANISGNASTATKATQDSAGQQISTTYIKGLSVSGRTITYTKGDGTTGTITTQDNNTTYSAATTSTNGLLSYSSNVATTSELKTYLGY